jgi:hypothetical protein
MRSTNHLRLAPKLTREAMYVERNIVARSLNNCGREKAVNIRFYECMCVALVTEHAERMCRVTLSSVACLAVPYFFIFSHKRYDFRGRGVKLLDIKCVFHLDNCVRNISHFKNNSARYCHKYTHVFLQNTRYSCEILMNIKYSRKTCEE